MVWFGRVGDGEEEGDEGGFDGEEEVGEMDD